MAFASTASTTAPRPWSLGPHRIEIQSYTAISGDTSGTITAAGLTEISGVWLSGELAAASIAISGKTVTLAFSDPVASVDGSVMLIGK